jgi:hypothetical protein
MCLSAESRPVNGGAGVKGTSAPVMWWHLIPRLAPALTGQERRDGIVYRGVLWARSALCMHKTYASSGEGHRGLGRGECYSSNHSKVIRSSWP